MKNVLLIHFVFVLQSNFQMMPEFNWQLLSLIWNYCTDLDNKTVIFQFCAILPKVFIIISDDIIRLLFFFHFIIIYIDSEFTILTTGFKVILFLISTLAFLYSCYYDARIKIEVKNKLQPEIITFPKICSHTVID